MMDTNMRCSISVDSQRAQSGLYALVMFIDAHCHLEKKYYGTDLPQVISRARAQGVAAMVAVGASDVAKGIAEAAALAEEYPFIYVAGGIHPHDAALATEADVAEVERWMAHPKVVALGEVGLDYFYESAPRDVQKALFKSFLQMAKRCNKPLMLHIRDAHEDALALIDEVGMPEALGLVHCFTRGPDLAREYVSRGFMLSIPGVLTFKNATSVQDTVREMDLDVLLLETDAPYLAPVPHRGKPNEPAYVLHTAACMAALKGVSVEEVASRTTSNAERLFKLPSVASF
jgi:TatD DNase family protein